MMYFWPKPRFNIMMRFKEPLNLWLETKNITDAFSKLLPQSLNLQLVMAKFLGVVVSLPCKLIGLVYKKTTCGMKF